MKSAPLPTDILHDMPFVDVLTDQTEQRIIGYHIGGDRPGPNALFAAKSPAIVAVTQRLIRLPTLPWMWGHLYLAALDLLHAERHAEVVQCVPGVSFDDMSILSRRAKLDAKIIDASYWQVLRMCTGLGMIQGRGVN